MKKVKTYMGTLSKAEAALMQKEGEMRVVQQLCSCSTAHVGGTCFISDHGMGGVSV